jgi:hypothetical protein
MLPRSSAIAAHPAEAGHHLHPPDDFNGHVPNSVTSLLAAYRGYDTMFETTVIFTAGVSLILLLRRPRREGYLQRSAPLADQAILRVVARCRSPSSCCSASTSSPTASSAPAAASRAASWSPAPSSCSR